MFDITKDRLMWMFLVLKENSPHNVCQIYIKPHSEHLTITLEFQIFVWNLLGYARHLSPFRSLNYTPRRAMDAAIARALVQICDVNSEQHIDLFCKN